MLTVGALGVLWATGARAGTLVVTATSPAVESDARLTRMTGDQARIVSVSAFTDLFDVVSVVNRAADDDCGGRVDLDAWRTSLQEARAQTTMLQTARALSMFAAAEVEAACLDRPPAAVDLVALQLSLADVHGQLADASEDDEERSSHRSEAEAALARAAVFGMGIAAPAGFDSALLAELDARRDALSESARRRQPRLIFAGQSSGIRLNGRPVAPNEALGGVAGTNLVQVVEGGQVTAAQLVKLMPGSCTLVWVAPAGERLDSADIARALAAPDSSAEGAAVLVAAAELLRSSAAEDVVRYAVVGKDVVDIYDAVDGKLMITESLNEPQRREVRSWKGAITVGPVLRYASRTRDSGEATPLDGLTGLAAGLELSASWAVRSNVVVAIGLRPAATRSDLPIEAGGGSVFRASVPMTFEGRWERCERALTPVLGLMVGADVVDAPGNAGFAQVFGAATAGAAIAIGNAGGLRAEARLGAGPGLLFGDATLATELRF